MMKKLSWSILCIMLLSAGTSYTAPKNEMSEQEKFIQNFLKDKDESNNRIDSDVTPDVSKSDGFIQRNNLNPNVQPKTKQETPKTKTEIPGKTPEKVNPWTGKSIPRKPSPKPSPPPKETQKQKPEWDWKNTKTNPQRSGSGFLINPSGHIVTNYHVVRNDDKLLIRTVHGDFPAQVVVHDKENDLTILKINSDKQFTPLPFSSANTISAGTEVFTIGFPMPAIQGFQPKVSKGIISSTSGVKDDLRHYQIAVPVQPGNSGGMLANLDGHIIGIIVATLKVSDIYRQTGIMPQNVNYAIKAYLLLELLDKSGLKNTITFAQKTDSPPSFEAVVNSCTNSVVMILVY